ncbi:hypothetical protein GCM10018790_51300 [Kitasatospora xanthocidica]|nr:hypothetical protein GCM10018790_51300 [Kitasatospora xanthocidica]
MDADAGLRALEHHPVSGGLHGKPHRPAASQFPAERQAPLDELLDLKVPPHLRHYLPMLAEAVRLPSGQRTAS